MNPLSARWPVSTLGGLLLATRAFSQNPGTPDESFRVGEGFNNNVAAVAVEADGGILCGGSFETYRGVPCRYLARLLPDGSLDAAFAQTPRPSGTVRIVVPLPDRRILVGGDFVKIGDVPRLSLAWLLPDGNLDLSVSADVPYGLAAARLLPGDQVLLTGSFVEVAGQPRSWIARLRADGSLDPDFNLGSQVFFAATSPVVLPGGRVLLNANWNALVAEDRRDLLFRVNPDGSPDLGFRTESPVGFAESLVRLPDGSFAVANNVGQVARLFENGPADPDWAARVPEGYDRNFLLTLRDGRVVCAVASVAAQGTRHVLWHLFADGSPDATFQPVFDFGVDCVAELPDGRLVVGGAFTAVNNLPCGHVVMLHGDPTNTPPAVRWNGAWFGAEERSGVARLPLFRTGRLDQTNTVHVRTGLETASGADYVDLDTDVTFAPGEAVKVVEVRVIDDAEPEPDEEFAANLEGKWVSGLGADARCTIYSDEGFISFGFPAGRISEAAASFSPELFRDGGVPYTADLTVPVVDHTAASNDLSLLPLQMHFAAGSRTAVTTLPIYDNPEPQPSRSVTWGLSALPPGYQVMLPANYSLTLVDNDFPGAPGEGLSKPAQLLATPAGGVLLAGAFTTVHGYSRPRLARLDAQGRFDAAFAAPWPDGDHVLLGATPDGRTYVSRLLPAWPPGSGSTSTNFVTRLLPDGSVDPAFTSTNRLRESAPRRGIVLGDGSVVLNRVVTDANGRVTELMKLDPAGQVVRAFASNRFALRMWTTDPILLGQQGGNGFLVAGPVQVPTSSSGPVFEARLNDLIRLSAAGVVDTNFLVQLQRPPWAIGSLIRDFSVGPGDRIYLQGIFTEVEGKPRPGLARLQPDGSLDAAFDPPAGLVSSATSLRPPAGVQADGRLVLVLPVRTELTRLQLSGPPDDSFGPVRASGGLIQSLALLPDGRIVISGDFTAINGQTRWRLAWLDVNGRLLPDQPMVLTASRTGVGDAVEVRLDSRRGGAVELLRSSLFSPWESLGITHVQPGSQLLHTATVPSATGMFFRSRSVE